MWAIESARGLGYLLAQQLVAAGEVVVAGFGPYEPLTTNDTAENRRMNRRVEIFVSDPVN